MASCFTNIVLDILFVIPFAVWYCGSRFRYDLFPVRQRISCHLYFNSHPGPAPAGSFQTWTGHTDVKTDHPHRTAIWPSVLHVRHVQRDHPVQHQCPGTDTVSAWAAYGKIDAIFGMIVSAFGIAITNFCGPKLWCREIRAGPQRY